jgi:hypothetical protein
MDDDDGKIMDAVYEVHHDNPTYMTAVDMRYLMQSVIRQHRWTRLSLLLWRGSQLVLLFAIWRELRLARRRRL